MVVLFGAGSTRAAFADRRPPPPLDADFFEIASQLLGRGTKRLAQTVTRDVFGLYGKVSGIGLEEYYRDIETRRDLSHIARARHCPMDWDARTDNLTELVRRVLIHTTCTLDAGIVASPLRSTVHRAILQKVEAKDTLLTFNYDTVIEESIEEDFGLWNPRDGYGIETTGITLSWSNHWLTARRVDRRSVSKIQILKLHGSLNWGPYTAGPVRLRPRPYVVRARRGAPVYDRAEILPPGWNKRVDRNPYRTIWAKARSALENCATLVVIGYSLPQTDLIARALFSEVVRSRLARGKHFKELHLADVSDTARVRVLDLFVRSLGPTGVVFRYNDANELARKWT